jgi:hypothetical protein
MSIPSFLAAISGGDLPADAVREDRCLKAPIGCGQPLIAEDGTTRVFWDEEEASRYEAEWRITGLCPDCQDALDAAEPITDLATAVEVMGALPMPAGPAQPATPRWHQLRTELIRMLRPYMPETARTKAVDQLDRLLVEVGVPAATPEWGVRLVNGDYTMAARDREQALENLTGLNAHNQAAVLVTRTVYRSAWTEATS